MDFEMKDCTFGNHPEYERGFKSGQQSKQEEIDKLKMSNHYLSVQVLDAEAYAEYWQKRSNKLQAEIDAFKEKINSALELMRQPMQGTVSDLLSELENILNDT